LPARWCWLSQIWGTPEPRNGMIEVKKAYTSQNLDFAQYAIAITSIDSNLDKLAKSKAGFSHVRLVGGRTSNVCRGLATSYRGIDIRAMLAGAKEMDATPHPNKNNPAALLTLGWYFAGNGRGEKMWWCCHTKTVCCCSVATTTVMERWAGKDLDGQIVHQGIAVYGNKARPINTPMSKLREGVPNFFMTF